MRLAVGQRTTGLLLGVGAPMLAIFCQAGAAANRGGWYGLMGFAVMLMIGWGAFSLHDLIGEKDRLAAELRKQR